MPQPIAPTAPLLLRSRQYQDLELHSAYQAIYSLSHQRPVGHEALIRATDSDGRIISPVRLFDMPEEEADVVRLDRLGRALHVENFSRQATPGWLFLNINPHVVMHGSDYGSFFGELLTRCDLPPHRVVVEILEHAIDDVGQLAEAVSFYRELGCLVAIDDFGAGHSNFDRIVRLQPDIVKLDRSLLEEAGPGTLARRILPRLVAMLHEAGALVVMEGVETREQALLTLEANADMVQGYYFSRPNELIPGESAEQRELIAGLQHEFNRHDQQHGLHRRQTLERHTQAFEESLQCLRQGFSQEQAFAPLLAMPGVARCYLLDEEGRQLVENLEADNRPSDPRLLPVNAAEGANWGRKPYFRNAIKSPGKLQVTSPYLSLSGAHMCITLSQSVQCREGTRVICCDLHWED